MYVTIDIRRYLLIFVPEPFFFFEHLIVIQNSTKTYLINFLNRMYYSELVCLACTLTILRLFIKGTNKAISESSNITIENGEWMWIGFINSWNNQRILQDSTYSTIEILAKNQITQSDKPLKLSWVLNPNVRHRLRHSQYFHLLLPEHLNWNQNKLLKYRMSNQLNLELYYSQILRELQSIFLNAPVKILKWHGSMIVSFHNTSKKEAKMSDFQV